MKVDRSVVEDYVLKYFSKVLNDDDATEKIGNLMKEKYKYPMVRFLDVISKRLTLSEISDYELYIILDCLIDRLDLSVGTNRYFTDEERKVFESTKWKSPKKVKFPIRFKMIEVANDQWIGSINAKGIVDLRNAGIIRYNENIQRTMRKSIKGGTVEYRIMENKRATKEIGASMRDRTFIPNTITLNIPDDEYSDFFYDETEMILTIRKARNLDIIDGFHRLIAIEQNVNSDSRFDYPMELRVTNYSTSKGQRFVFQEDQKTKMSKMESNAFNVENEAVKATTRLNENTLFNLSGEIGRNKGLISFAEMSSIIEKLYFKGINKKEAKLKSITLPKQLCEDFNWLTEADPSLLTHQYTWRDLCIILVGFEWIREHGLTSPEKEKILLKAFSNADKIDQRRFRSKTVSSHTINSIHELLQECSHD